MTHDHSDSIPQDLTDFRELVQIFETKFNTKSFCKSAFDLKDDVSGLE